MVIHTQWHIPDALQFVLVLFLSAEFKFLSAATALNNLAFVFAMTFPVENVRALLDVLGKTCSFSQGT